jgi:hypothetical protein
MNSHKKITVDNAIEWELQSLADAIGNCLELNDDFIGRYCGARVAAQLRRIPEDDREYYLQSHIGDGRAVGGFYSLGESSIVIPVGEIEYQFDGAPEDTFEDVRDWTISGNLAYTGLDGAEFPVDVESLAEEIDEFLSGDCPDEFVESYLECSLWSSTDDDGRPLDDNYGVDDIDRETRKTAETECADFWRRHGWAMARDVSRAGHDFWLTRNGHGAGFWDGQWNADGDRLTSAAKVYGSVDLYVGDDGRIHG